MIAGQPRSDPPSVAQCVSVAQHVSVAQCAPVVLLSLRILADLRAWVGAHPVLGTAPLEAMAMTAAAISPWRSAAELRLCARMYIWTYAFDDHVERDIDDLSDLENLLERCREVACDGRVDHSVPLVSALSDWVGDLRASPLFPALSQVWSDRVESALRGIRYDWVVGHDHTLRQLAHVRDYLAHADSILVGMTHLPRWMTSDGLELVDHLDVLLPAMSDTVVAIRLANDLATHSWERGQDGQNNILMYGVSADWVRAEMDGRATAVVERMASLSERDFSPAVEMVRHIEWATTFYGLADFRGWGSDVPTPKRSGV